MTVDDRAYPGPVRSWSLTAILVVVYAISFVDRQILGLLVQDLRNDLAIGDAQIGLLQGPAFGVCYAIMGLPLGWLADRTNRVRLIAGGLLVWTSMTVLGGFADSFEMLFATRIGVGIGEAALVPAAVSLLADCFPPARRAAPLAVFTAGISVGAGLALIVGGGLIAFARDGAAALPLIGGWFAGRAAWQTVLILAGLIGLPLVLVVLLQCEPARRHSPRDAAAPASERNLLGFLASHRALFVPMLAGTSLLYLFSNAFSSWMPSLFVREFGWTPAAVGLRLGPVLLVGSLLGTLASGLVASALIRAGRPGGALVTMAIGAGLLAPAATLGPLAGDPVLAQAAVALIYFALSLCFGVATASFVAVTPAPIRGRMIALYLLLGNLVGLGLGPPAVGLILDRALRDPAQVGVALAIVAAVTVFAGAGLLVRALAPHAKQARAMTG